MSQSSLNSLFTYNPAAFTALGHWSSSVSCNGLLCAHFRSSHLFSLIIQTQWHGLACWRVICRPRELSVFCASWIIREFHSSSRKWRWATAFGILLDLLQGCVGNVPFASSYMHNTDIRVLPAQTNVIYSLSFQEPWLFFSLEHSSKFNLHENILKLTLLIQLSNFFI